MDMEVAKGKPDVKMMIVKMMKSLTGVVPKAGMMGTGQKNAPGKEALDIASTSHKSKWSLRLEK